MDKVGLIKAISKETGKKQSDAKIFLEATLNVITTTLKNNEKINLNKFGSFNLITRKETKERKQYSPIIKKMITIPSKNESLKISFKAATALENIINNG